MMKNFLMSCFSTIRVQAKLQPVRIACLRGIKYLPRYTLNFTHITPVHLRVQGQSQAYASIWPGIVLPEKSWISMANCILAIEHLKLLCAC